MNRPPGPSTFGLRSSLRRPIAFAIILFGLLVLPVCYGLDPAKSVFQFNVQSWTRHEGLPGDKVSAIAQTTDGYLWLGTQHGLVRFDGAEFKPVAISLPDARGQDVQRLSTGAGPGVWFSIREGGVGHYDGRTFRAIRDPRWEDPRISANTVLLARDGSVWTGTVNGASRWVEGTPEATFFAENIESTGSVRVLFEDDAGVWVGTSEHGVYRFVDGALQPVRAPGLERLNVAALARDRDGWMWVGSGLGLRAYDAQWQLREQLLPGVEINALLVDGHGVLWIGTTRLGLGRYQAGKLTFLRKSDGLASDQVTALHEDAEGSLWVGTQEGLSQLSDLKFPIYSAAEGLLPGSGVWIAASHRGGFWLGLSSGLSYFDGTEARNYDSEALLPNRYVRSLFEASNGELYVSDGDKNIDILAGERLVGRIPCDAWPDAFAEDTEGVLAGIGTRLFRVRDAQLNPFPLREGENPDLNWINTLLVARDGGVWVATNDGVARIHDGRVTRWSTGQGLSSGRAHCLLEDADGTIWAGLASGIARIRDGKVANIRLEHGLPDQHIYAMVADELGHIWFSSGRGFFQISREALGAVADGKSVSLKAASFDGLESIKFADRTDQGFAGCRTLDGRIWFPSPRGVVMIDPRGYFSNRVPPKLNLDRVFVNGQERPPGSRLVLAPTETAVEFHFTAVSFIAPRKLRVQYQLVGADSTWMDAGARRFVRYESLRPGQYAFRLRAANADGLWSAVEDRCTFDLPPPFYQTAWFYGACLAALLGVVYGVVRWNLRHLHIRQAALQAQNAQLEQRVRERTKELEKSLSLFHATIESSVDGIVVADLSGRITLHNERFAAIWGGEKVTLMGRTLLETDSELSRQLRNSQTFRQHWSDVRSRPELERIETVEFADGRVFECLVCPQRVQGQCVGVVVHWREVTERLRAQSELAYERDLLRTLFDHLPDRIFFKDRDCRFVRCSAEVPRLLGRPMTEVIGKTEAELNPIGLGPRAIADEQEVIRTGQPRVGIVEKQVWPGGRETWSLGSKMPWRNPAGEVIGVFGISQDITPLKAAEAKLEQLHKQLLESSRQAGMAEVATSVLHNVGNVLNSVNVSSTLVLEQVRESKAAYVERVASMLEEHAGDLAAFLSQDPKGQKLTGFVRTLAHQLAAEQQTILEELGHLEKNIDHIKEIVAMQQSYARVAGVAETLPLHQIVEDALHMNSGALTRHGVELVREFGPETVLTTERHKVLQILVNLIRNAKYACDDSGRPDKRIILRTGADKQWATVSVIDNGIGIAPENLTRIFGHGFTTRKDGHGFGLHSGSLAAKELGGDLTARSDGPGRGATFTLLLPLRRAPAPDRG